LANSRGTRLENGDHKFSNQEVKKLPEFRKLVHEMATEYAPLLEEKYLGVDPKDQASF